MTKRTDLQPYAAELEARVNGMAGTNRLGPAQSTTELGTPYATFFLGGMKAEGDPLSSTLEGCPIDVGEIPEHVNLLVRTIAEYKARVAPAAKAVVWRIRPYILHQPEGDFDPEKFNIRCRLAFE